jgi:hypothetical protein
MCARRRSFDELNSRAPGTSGSPRSRNAAARAGLRSRRSCRTPVVRSIGVPTRASPESLLVNGATFEEARVPKSRSADDHPRESVPALREAVDQLRRQLHELEESIAAEVVTRSIVVADDDGLPRVVIRATGSFGNIEVFARSDLGGPSSAELFASDAADGEGPHLGVALTERGDVVAIFEALGGEAPTVWLRPGALPGPSIPPGRGPRRSRRHG